MMDLEIIYKFSTDCKYGDSQILHSSIIPKFHGIECPSVRCA
jgi:hypothetical protein